MNMIQFFRIRSDNILNVTVSGFAAKISGQHMSVIKQNHADCTGCSKSHCAKVWAQISFMTWDCAHP